MVEMAVTVVVPETATTRVALTVEIVMWKVVIVVAIVVAMMVVVVLVAVEVVQGGSNGRNGHCGEGW